MSAVMPSLKKGFVMCWKHRYDAAHADCAANGMNWQWAGNPGREGGKAQQGPSSDGKRVTLNCCACHMMQITLLQNVPSPGGSYCEGWSPSLLPNFHHWSGKIALDGNFYLLGFDLHCALHTLLFSCKSSCSREEKKHYNPMNNASCGWYVFLRAV